MPALRLRSEDHALYLKSVAAGLLKDCRFWNPSPNTIDRHRYSLGPFVRFIAEREGTVVVSACRDVVRVGGSPFHLQKIRGDSGLGVSRRSCEFADVDALPRQEELSPVPSLGLLAGKRRRMG
jgi:hypothetical protein